MTIDECIKQMESLRAHCEAMFDDKFASDETWDRDITALDMAISRMKQAGWVSVKDRLPEEGERVLATDGDFVGEAYLMDYHPVPGVFGRYWYRSYGANWSLVSDKPVTHWMPLPEPPEGA